MSGETDTIEPRLLLPRLTDWANRVGLARKLAVALAVAAAAAALLTYAALSGSSPFGTDARTILILLQVDLVLFLLLGIVVIRRLVTVWLERRRGSVGSRLHSRLVLLFSLIALTPTVIVSVFSAVFFSFGVQAWFSDRVKTAVEESSAVAQAYLEEHQQSIRGDILAMARDISRGSPTIWNNPAQFSRLLAAQGLIRNLTEAYVVDRTGRPLGRWRQSFVLDSEPVPISELDRAAAGEIVVLVSENEDRLRAIVRLEGVLGAYLYISRYVDAKVLSHIERTRAAATQYADIEGQRSSFEITFAMMFVLVALLLLVVAVWLGLTFATRLSRPITALATAAERVRSGDLSSRVEESGVDDELSSLSRSFNRMTDQLGQQREELVEANRQIDARRHFMETVLAGVSAGVIGLDGNGRINLPNRAASDLLFEPLDECIGRPLGEVVPEFADLVEEALSRPRRLIESEIRVRRAGNTRTFLTRIAVDRSEAGQTGFVVTFDDISELLSAQRKAAWSDVARRIAHEIKNPLTPIQLSAERLRRKYLKEITTDPETFEICTDTIVRQVGDIGRMVDEFSAFARMPTPTMERENLVVICRDALSLQRHAWRDIEFEDALGEGPISAVCDRRQIGQALTNLLQNAVDSIQGRLVEDRDGPGGEIRVELVAEHAEADDPQVRIVVQDNGRGLPTEARDQLTEPYVTTRERGTGLGLAIVKKIMEDHGGDLVLEDRSDGVRGARVALVLSLSSAESEDSDDRDADGTEAADPMDRGEVVHGA